MENYYHRRDVRQGILDFVFSGSSTPLRECAFYNEKIGRIQRHVYPNESDYSVFVISSDSSFNYSLHEGATAFYSSYWRYSNPYAAKHPRGRDIVWTLRAKEGGLSIVKEVGSTLIDVLQDEGFCPLVKYSGELGLDILIPFEDAEEMSVFDSDSVYKAQWKFTWRISNKVSDRTDFILSKRNSHFVFKGSLGTCLLSELSWRRGLILAPMSLHPSSGLVSLPISLNEINDFSPLNASPESVFSFKWSISSRLKNRVSQPSFASESDLSSVKA